MTTRFRRITLNGADLGYAVHGAGGPPLVFAHGYAMRATGALYDGLLDRLAQQFVVHALDLRGHGTSASAVAGWSYEAIADDLAAFAAALDLDRPLFVGHSFGCVVGLLAAIKHLGCFRSLCLLEPGPANSTHDPVDMLDALIEHGYDRAALHEAFAGMFVRPCADKLNLVVDAAALVDADVHRAQRDQNPHFSIEDRLQNIGTPALVLCGRRDSVVDPARQHDLANRLPAAKEVVFASEGHMLAIENPAVAVKEITTFVNDNAGSLIR